MLCFEHMVALVLMRRGMMATFYVYCYRLMTNGNKYDHYADSAMHKAILLGSLCHMKYSKL